MANFRENTPTVVAMTAENLEHRDKLAVVELTTTFVNERFMCRCAEQLFINECWWLNGTNGTIPMPARG